MHSRRWQVMGIVNITPDSFSDGGRYLSHEAAIAHAASLLEAGADMLDLGAESTRPGAQPVGVQEELDRLMPVLVAVRAMTDAVISVDTYKPEVMRAAIAAGADMINDVYALRQPDALSVVAGSQVSACLMHMQGTPGTMQQAPTYDRVVDEVADFLQQRLQEAAAAGIGGDRLWLDPGFGFGKTLEQNLALFRALPQLSKLGQPLLVGVSRKRMIAQMAGREDMASRDAGSVAAAVEAIRLGARAVRVHAVVATVAALRVAESLGAFDGPNDEREI